LTQSKDRFLILQINLKHFIAVTVIYRTYAKPEQVAILLL